MWTLDDFRKVWNTSAEINGKWVPSRPVVEPFLNRLKDAWAVLVGNADAVKWPEGQ